MADLDLPRVRAEIKSWERDFLSAHGRDPNLQDIREHPPIAEKYKLYKKLSKPPASRRTALPVPPLPGFNPFSPDKKSANRSPFATPTRNKPKPRPPPLTPSPDPALPSRPNATASTTAVSRARKRLRGEPVSPSPNKPKRQRVRSQAPPVPRSDQDSSDSEHEQLPCCDLAAFVADSPVKPPAGGKSFELLFDDALPSLSVPKRPVGSSVAQLDSPDAGCSHQPSSDSSVPTTRKFHGPDSKRAASGPERRSSHPKTIAQIFPAKDQSPAPLTKHTFEALVPEGSQPRMSVKRPLDVGTPQHESTGSSVPLRSQCSLVPPSPPPQDTFYRDIGKAKTKTAASRKKMRVEDAESGEEADNPDDIALKVATVSSHRINPSSRDPDELNWDPLLHLGTRSHDPAVEQQTDANHHALGTFSVNLPDKFRRVLAISPSRNQNDNEDRVVRGLLYGDRIGHYNPSRGGDIWDVGETDDGALGDVETEDDWEGEPVPWEVGEL